MLTLSYHPTSNKTSNGKSGSGKGIHSHHMSSKHKQLSFLIVLSFILHSLSNLPVSATKALRKNGQTKKEMGLQDESGLSSQIIDPNHSTNTESRSSAASLLSFAHTEEDITILEAIYNMANNDGDDAHPVWFNPPPSFSTHRRLLRTAGDKTRVFDLEEPQACYNFVGSNQGHCTAFLSVQGGTCCIDAASTLCSKIEEKFIEPLTKGAICTTESSVCPANKEVRCCPADGAGLGDDCSATSGCPCSADLLCDGL